MAAAVDDADAVNGHRKASDQRGEARARGPASAKVARWQNLIPSFPWIAPGWRAWGQESVRGLRERGVEIHAGVKF